MAVDIKNAINALQAGDPLDVIRQNLEAAIPAGLPEDVKAGYFRSSDAVCND